VAGDRSLAIVPLVSIEEVLGGPLQALSASAILDHVYLPPFRGDSAHDDLSPLLQVVNKTQPRLIFEIGTGWGNITANMCRQSLHSKVYTVNPDENQQEGRLTTYRLRLSEIGSVYRAYGFGDRVVQIYESSLSVRPELYLQGQTIDLAVIDGCHDMMYVMNDFLKVANLMTPGGIVLMHDTHPSIKDDLSESYSACLRLRSAGYAVRHIGDTWWGVWTAPVDRWDSRP
jgi:predicted O-methyltransferase YrrM